MGKKNSGKLIEEEDGLEGIEKIQDDLYWVSIKMKGFSKLFFPEAANDGRDFDSEELNGIGEMILDFSKTIGRVHDDVETFKLNLHREERNHGKEKENQGGK
jgi:hypothetical protein